MFYWVWDKLTFICLYEFLCVNANFISTLQVLCRLPFKHRIAFSESNGSFLMIDLLKEGWSFLEDLLVQNEMTCAAFVDQDGVRNCVCVCVWYVKERDRSCWWSAESWLVDRKDHSGILAFCSYSFSTFYWHAFVMWCKNFPLAQNIVFVSYVIINTSFIIFLKRYHLI